MSHEIGAEAVVALIGQVLAQATIQTHVLSESVANIDHANNLGSRRRRP